uniref:LysM domain-containing protein n=1 Tax=Tetradesmus obliquus TaxID=3088 RepID=A0A383VYU3_TETOB|eukprot:jgi/Sobl393_1/19772/SZX70049.1
MADACRRGGFWEVDDGFEWHLPEGFSSKASGCPQFPGYYFIPGKTYDQYDMVKSCSSSSSAELAAECTKTSYCQAFTTAGMMKYRIPPGELGTGTTKTGRSAVTLCFQESPTEQALHNALPLHRRQLLQLGKGNYNSWRNTTRTESRCAGTYVSKSGGFESWLRTGYDMSDNDLKAIVPKANQAMKQAGTLYQTISAKGGGRGGRGARLAKLTGDKMVVKSPLDATIRKLGLNTRVTSQQAVSNFMLECALPVAYDSTSASDTGGYNFIPPAPDQAACGVCAAFAVAGLAHAAMAAATKQSYTAVPALSAQHMYFCAGKEAAARTCANGTTIDSVLQQLVKSAPLQERCLPWSKPGGLKRPTNVCSKRCSSSAGGSFKWGKLYDIAAAKEAIVRNGAVAAVMLLYPDLTPSTRCRPQQVYARRSAIPADLVMDPHAVLAVGWDDRGESWLVRNSWGSWPGGSRPGFFKVKYGEAGLMAPGFMYALSWTGPGAKARTLGPKFIQRDPTNASCSWYTAQPGDTLAGVWRASGVKRLQQLLAANTNTGLIDGSRLAGKRVRICK